MIHEVTPLRPINEVHSIYLRMAYERAALRNDPAVTRVELGKEVARLKVKANIPKTPELRSWAAQVRKKIHDDRLQHVERATNDISDISRYLDDALMDPNAIEWIEKAQGQTVRLTLKITARALRDLDDLKLTTIDEVVTAAECAMKLNESIVTMRHKLMDIASHQAVPVKDQHGAVELLPPEEKPYTSPRFSRAMAEYADRT